MGVETNTVTSGAGRDGDLAGSPRPEGKAWLVQQDRPGAAREQWIAWVRLFWQERRLLARVGVLATLWSMVVALLLPPQYTSTTRVLPPESGFNSTALLGALPNDLMGPAAAFASAAFGRAPAGTAFTAILESETVRDRIVTRFQLQKIYGRRSRELARSELAQNTRILQNRKTSVIEVAVSDRDPQRAADLANTYAEELDRMAAELNTGAAHRERLFIEGRLKQVKQELEDAARGLSEFASRNAAVDLKEQGRALLEAAAQLQGQVAAEQATLQGLQQIYTAQNVRVRASRARIEELQRLLREIQGGEASAPPGVLQASTSSGYPAIRSLPLLAVAYSNLYRRLKIQEAVFETLTQQYELAKIQEAKETATVRVLDRARAPEFRTSPRRKMLVMSGTVLSLLLAVLWIAGRQRWQRLDATDPVRVLAVDIGRGLEVWYARVAAWWQRKRSSPSLDTGGGQA